ncbi:MAG: hypothetical protein GX763_06825 [Clostridiaceae bacterium]|nr:hypothetical protein [Clostridiaceae bacterium]
MKKVIVIIVVLALSVMTLVSCGVPFMPKPGKTAAQQATVNTAGGNVQAKPGKNDKPGVSGGKLEAWESYEIFQERKSDLVTTAMERMGGHEDLAFEMFRLMSVLSIDFVMLPAALIGQEEVNVVNAMRMMGTDVKYSKTGNSYVVEWLDKEGQGYKFATNYDPAKESMSSEVNLGEEGKDTIYYDYIRTSYGYFAKIITNNDSEGGFPALTLISIDANGGVIGMSTERVQHTPLNGNESRDLPKSLPQWYEVDGKIFSALTAEGESYTYELEP